MNPLPGFGNPKLVVVLRFSSKERWGIYDLTTLVHLRFLGIVLDGGRMWKQLVQRRCRGQCRARRFGEDGWRVG